MTNSSQVVPGSILATGGRLISVATSIFLGARSRLLVRGDRGEIIDMRTSYLQDSPPRCIHAQRQVAGANGNLEGNYLKGITAGDKWHTLTRLSLRH